MKKSELHQIIREEIRKVLSEKDAGLQVKDVQGYWVGWAPGFNIASEIADQAMDILTLSKEQAKDLAISKFFRHYIQDDLEKVIKQVVKKSLTTHKNKIPKYI